MRLNEGTKIVSESQAANGGLHYEPDFHFKYIDDFIYVFL